MAEKMSDRALKMVNKIIKEMPEKEKQRIFDQILMDKDARDHVLKIMLWTYCNEDIKRDIKRRDNLGQILDKLEKKKLASEKTRA
jgi:hypothetical protein